MHRPPPASIKHNHVHFNDPHAPKDAPNVGINQYL
jgi:hypothetical protein